MIIDKEKLKELTGDDSQLLSILNTAMELSKTDRAVLLMQATVLKVRAELRKAEKETA